jgi:hypothetical protein
MPRFIVDIWLDGYDTEEEMIDACEEFIYEQLNFSASNVKIEKIDEDWTMTDEQILNLASMYFYQMDPPEGRTEIEWIGSKNDILEFARDIKNKQIGKIIEQLESQIGE